MAVKPENQFISSVDRHLPVAVYRCKMSNPYIRGIPDKWYSGTKGDLWIEYKFIPRIPVKAPIVIDLTELQKDWLENRHREGRNVAIVVGSPKGGVILRPNGCYTITPQAFVEALKPRAEIAQWIISQTGT